MLKTIILTTSATLLLLSGCASSSGPGSVKGVGDQNVYQAIEAAEKRYDDIGEIEGLIPWRNTKSHIKNAKEHVRKALELAQEAKYEADMAIKESDEFDKTWQDAVPK